MCTKHITHETRWQDTSVFEIYHPKLTVHIDRKIAAVEICVIAHKRFVAEISFVLSAIDFIEPLESL